MTNGNGVKNGSWISHKNITPILIMMIGALISLQYNGISSKLVKLESHFINHLMHHEDLEVGYEHRITKIESTRFTNKDGDLLENKLMRNLPPKWLINRVEHLEEKLKKR